jgi:hypothetical protein
MMERSDNLAASALFDAARAEAHPRELAREAETVAAMAAIVSGAAAPTLAANSRRTFMLVHPLRVRTVALLAALTLAATSALANAGALPGPAQDVVSDALESVGLSLPSQAGGVEAVEAAATGAEISALALGAEAAQAEKGALIAAAASGGASEAGAARAGASVASAPVETPNSGGTATADQASGGASTVGTATANEESGGASAAGSGNAETAGDENASAGAANAGAGLDTAGSAADNVPTLP